MAYKYETANMKTRKTFDVTGKARIYQTLAQMGSSFSAIIQYCADLAQAGALKPKAKNRFQAFTIEVQGELDLEVLEHMDGIETEDWARAGRVREKWEKYLRFESERSSKKSHKAQKSTFIAKPGSPTRAVVARGGGGKR
jgi:hypothetical protein